MARIRVLLELPALEAEDLGSVVRLVLRDTSMADQLHPTVAETSGAIDSDDTTVEMVLDIPDGTLWKDHHYSLWAHVDRDGSGRIAAGDLIVTENVPVTVEDLRDGEYVVSVSLTRI